jgi:transposase
MEIRTSRALKKGPASSAIFRRRLTGVPADYSAAAETVSLARSGAALSDYGRQPRLVRITKRGSKYLRKLIIQRAWAALPPLARTPTPLGG